MNNLNVKFIVEKIFSIPCFPGVYFYPQVIQNMNISHISNKT